MGRRFVRAVGALALGVGLVSCETPTTGPIPVATVIVAPNSLNLASGADTLLSASVLGPSGAPIPGREVAWAVADAAVATVSSVGLVEATVVLGPTPLFTIVTASSGGRSGQALVTVAPSPAVSLTLTPLQDALVDGDLIPISHVLRNAAGDSLTGRTIVWTSRDTMVARIFQNGRVQPVPFLGIDPREAVIVATVAGLRDSITVTVLPTAINEVIVRPGAVYLAPGWTKQLEAIARTSGGSEIRGLTASWEMLDPGAVDINATGRVEAATLGSGTVRATIGEFTGDASVTVNSCGAAPPGNFSLEVRYVGPAPSAAVQASFNCAVARLRGIIRTPLSSITFTNENISECVNGVTLNETVPGLLILASIGPIDGVGNILGRAGPCFLRSSNLLPIVGRMEFDEADLQQLADAGSLPTVVLHEMLHVIGIGTVWGEGFLGLVQIASGRPFFMGGLARTACLEENGGGSVCQFAVPIEDCLNLNQDCGVGTQNVHWKESTFGTELMTGFLQPGFNAFSAMTIQTLADLGYGVDPLQANDYTVPTASMIRMGQLLGAPGVTMPAPLRPTHLVDRDGTLTPIPWR